MWLVIWESKPTNLPRDSMAQGWRWSCQYFETETGARLVYDSLIPGSLAPVEYRNITMAKVVSKADDRNSG